MILPPTVELPLCGQGAEPRARIIKNADANVMISLLGSLTLFQILFTDVLIRGVSVLEKFDLTEQVK